MKGFSSNTQLLQLIFDELREILKITLLIREMVLKEEFERLPDYLSQREQKIERLAELLNELKGIKNEIPNFQQVKSEIKTIFDEVLKIEAENADNIREKMKEISEELIKLIERRKILNYLR
ncbi:hypothetical protein [Candidatus Kryptobacter tengchongensis]|uniref:hypothetical protein n=1 Tax=Kryptobacter tengchongensis TaxID=1643429 RepID=UPI0007076E67|nr:hypothetical protein [Candidatus Kryptobacter tengchongensis]CUS79611.1 hypothetical protein JGI20_00622 [Candidatus Kryptobacter tengchongensis]